MCARWETRSRASLPTASTWCPTALDQKALREPFEPVRQFRPLISLIRQLGDEQREGLGVAGDPQGTSVHRIEPHVANQRRGDLLALRIISAINEAGPDGFAAGLEDAQKHLARHGVES